MTGLFNFAEAGMNIKKILSVVTAACFTFSFVFGETLHAALDAPADAGRALPALEDFVIPQSCGRITDSKLFGSKQVVVNIQDLHCHPEVQRNISKILSALDKKYGLKNVYVEGGYGNINTSWICDVKDKQVKKEIMEGLIDRGRLTGSEYYSAVSNRPELLKGIEDERVHKANIVRLGKILEKKRYFEEKLKLFDKDLEFMKIKYFSSRRNRNFNKLIEEHKAGRITTEKYYALLSRYVKKINEDPDRYNNIFTISMENYPNISAYLELNRIQSELKYRRISRQLQEFMQSVKSRIPYGVYNSLLEKTDNFTKMDEFYIYLARLAKGYNFDLDNNFPDLKRFFEYAEKSRKLNPINLIEEEKRLVEEIRIGFSRDISELEVSFLSDFYGYFKDYLGNTLSANDYKYFVQRFDKFKSVWNKYAFNNGISGLNEDFKLFDDFYKTNCKRNECFLGNIAEINSSGQRTGDREFRDRAPASEDASSNTAISGLIKNSEIVVVVTGGFHTEGLKGLLRDKKISYLCVTPGVTRDTGASGAIYTELAKRQARLFGSQALALALSSLDAKVISVTKNEIIVELEGERVTLTRNGENRFELPGKWQEILALGNKLPDKAAIEAGVNEGLGIASKIELFVNPALSTELIYQLAKHFSQWEAREGIYSGNGLIWSIASNSRVQEIIGARENIPTDELGRLSDFIQEAIRNHALNQEKLSVISKDSALVDAIVSVPGMQTFIGSLSEGKEHVSQMTLGETIKNYVKAHPVARAIYERNILGLGRGLVIAWISISLGERGSPRAELERIAAAIALKVGGDETELNAFIDAHKPEGMSRGAWAASDVRKGLAGGLRQIEDTVVRMLPDTGWTNLLDNKTIANAIVRAHFEYNLGILIKTTLVNIGRIFTGNKLISYHLLLTNNAPASSRDILKNVLYFESKFDDSNEDVRDTAANVTGTVYAELVHQGKEINLASLETKVNDRNWMIREAAIKVLGPVYAEMLRQGKGINLSLIEAGLKDLDEHVQVAAQKAMGQVYVEQVRQGNDINLSRLELRLGHPSGDIRTASAGALGPVYAEMVRQGKNVNLSRLDQRFNDSEERVVTTAGNAIGTIYVELMRQRKEINFSRIITMLGNNDGNMRTAAALITGAVYAEMLRQGENVDLSRLEAKLNDNVLSVRYAAVKAAGQVYAEMARQDKEINLAPLESKINDSSGYVRDLAADVLGATYVEMLRQGKDIGIASLEAKLNGSDIEARRAAVTVIGAVYVEQMRQGNDISISSLETKLNDSDDAVKRVAIRVIRRVYAQMVRYGKDISKAPHEAIPGGSDEVARTEPANPTLAVISMLAQELAEDVRSVQLENEDINKYTLWNTNGLPYERKVVDRYFNDNNPLGFVEAVKKKAKETIENGFEYTDREACWYAYVGAKLNGIGTPYEDFNERVNELGKFDAKHPGYFRNLFSKAGTLRSLEVSTNEIRILDVSGVDVKVFDANLALLMGVKDRIDSLDWIGEFSSVKAFTIKNLYFQMKKSRAIESGQLKEGERLSVDLSIDEETMKAELLKDRKEFYKAVFRIAKDRLGDGQIGGKSLALLHDLIVSDVLMDEALVNEMKSADVERKMLAFKNFYEDYKNHLPNSVGAETDKIKGLPALLAKTSKGVYEEIGKAKAVRKAGADSYTLIPQGFLSVFRGRAGMTDCSFDMDKGHPFTRAMHGDTIYYYVYKGKELKGYVGMMRTKTPEGKQVLAIDTVNSPSLDGVELLTNLFKGLDMLAREMGCIGIALPEDMGPSFNFDNEKTIKHMGVYKDGIKIKLAPLHDDWEIFTQDYGKDRYNSIDASSKFKLINLSSTDKDTSAGATGKTPMTLGETIKNYVKAHPVARALYERNMLGIGRGLVIAWISISLGERGSPKAELEQIATAIALKARGDETGLTAFIDAHKPEGMSRGAWAASDVRRGLAGGLQHIEDIVVRMLPDTGWTNLLDNKTIARAIVRVHFGYNLGILIRTTLVNIGRIFTANKLISYALLVTNNASGRLALNIWLIIWKAPVNSTRARSL